MGAGRQQQPPVHPSAAAQLPPPHWPPTSPNTSTPPSNTHPPPAPENHPTSFAPPGPCWQMIELLQHIPRHVATTGRYAREFFTRDGRLRHIHRMHFWPLDRVLADKYRLPVEEVGGTLCEGVA